MSEKDKADVELMLSSYSFPVAFTNRRTADVNQRLRDAIVNMLTAVRKKARQAAFREMIQLAQAIKPDGSINFVGDWNRAKKQFLALIQAAANTEEGAENGTTSKA